MPSPRSLALLLCAVSLAACGGGSATDVVNADGATDVPVGTDSAGDVPMDTPAPRCGAMRPDIMSISGTEGLVIGPDGTIYYSQANAVGRMRPGEAQDDAWAPLGARAGTVWGLALDVANHMIYAGSPSAGTIFSVDYMATPPTVANYVPSAGQPNGLTMGPDGALYYSDFGAGAVFRVAPGGTRTRASSTTAIGQANGLAFGTDGSLYVLSYAAGTLNQLTMAGGMETGRTVIARMLGNPDGLALDATGRFYVTNNSGGTLTRLDADGTNPMRLLSGVSAAASVEFGAGALNCNDIYVASGGALRRYEMGDTAGAMVPWHP